MTTLLKKTRLLALLVVAAGSLMIVAGSNVRTTSLAAAEDDQAHDEINQTYQLSPGAQVEIYSINGPVEVETGSGSSAQVHVIRSAPSQADLDKRKVLIDATATSLAIHEEKSHSEGHIKTQVILTVPAQINLNVHGINGAVKVANIEGKINLNGINGRVQVDQAMEASSISGINGHVSVNLVRVGAQGLKLSGINGAIELHFAESVNANLEADGINGGIYTELPNLTIQGKVSTRNFRAQVGSGGPVVSLTGINGKVHLTSDGK